MPDYNDLIADFTRGRDYEIVRGITNIPPGDTLAEAWMTVKRRRRTQADSEAIIQKHVTPSNVVGVGQITDTGATDLVGAVRFDWTPADTIKFVADEFYDWDITVLTTNGKKYTPISGYAVAFERTTRA